MYLFDTNHVSLIDRGGEEAQNILARLKRMAPDDIAVSVISYDSRIDVLDSSG